jgi:hypothetical protein
LVQYARHERPSKVLTVSLSAEILREDKLVEVLPELREASIVVSASC